MVELDPEVSAYYERGDEADRLLGGSPSGPLELARTQELIDRHLPADEGLRILDVGGGPGVYAGWLAGRGHSVHLVDPIPLHVEQARAAHPEVAAEIGDARSLAVDDAAFDVVLLLGPLYHLLDRDERIRALQEAWRVLRPGGLLFAAAIARYAAVLDLLIRVDRMHEPAVYEAATDSARTGVFRGSVGGLFTNAYFHLPDELRDEVTSAGLADVQVFNVEGPGALVSDFAERWADPDRRGAILQTARDFELEPVLQTTGSHLLAAARRPS